MKRLSLILLTTFIISCTQQNGDLQLPIDCIELGAAFLPGVLLSSSSENYVANYNEDIILIHYGDNVPWEFLIKCEDLDNCVLSGEDAAAYADFDKTQDDLEDLVNALNKKVYVSASALNNERNGVAINFLQESNLGYSPPGDDFADEDIRTLYKKWVSYLITKFNPDYLSQGVEFNMYIISNPNDFSNLVSLMQEVKNENQGRTFIVGPSIQWESFKQSPVTVDWNQVGDGIAISTYPHLFDPSDTSQVSASHYNFEDHGILIANRPLFIAETGIQHEYQVSLLNTLFGLRDSYDLRAVMWFFKEDIEAYFATLPDEYPYTVFKRTGLYTDSYAKNLGATVWEEELACA